MDTYKKFAVDLARNAGEIMKKNFSLGMKKEWKADDSPITATDKEVNQLVLNAIGRAFPDHSIISEEGSALRKSDYVWVCDPVDGTIPFSHGYPTFAFSLALTKNGESVLGVLFDPVNDRMLVAEKGKGAFLNDMPIRVSQSEKFSETSLVNLDGDYQLSGLREALITKGCYVSTFYSCTYPSILVALGEFLAEIYEFDKPWDAAAVKIIVEEAGGKVTDLYGNEQRYDRPIQGFIASNGSLHAELVALVASVFKK